MSDKLQSYLQNSVNGMSSRENRAVYQSSLNPKGIPSQSPGLAFSSQPWVSRRNHFPTLKGLRLLTFRLAAALIATTPSGLQDQFPLTQGWLENANPGLCYGIPLGFKSPPSVEFCKWLSVCWTSGASP